MPFSDNVEYLMSHPGTVAAVVWNGSTTLFAGHNAWRDVLGHAIFMMDESKESIVAAFVGEHSILAETRDGQQCAVVYPTGHPVAKVMRRMMRNAAGPKRTKRVADVWEAAPAAAASE